MLAPRPAALVALRLGVGALVAAVAATLPSGAAAQLPDSSMVVSPRVVAAKDKVAPGGQLPVAVQLALEEGWHLQTNDPQVPPELGDASFYIPTEIVPLEGDGGVQAHPEAIQWQPVHMVDVAFLGEPVSYGVFGDEPSYLPVTVATDAEAGMASLDLALTYQACDDISCLAPVSGEVVRLEVPIVSAASLAEAPAADVEPALFADFDPSVWERVSAGVRPRELVRFDLFGAGYALDVSGNSGLLLLLLIAALGGLLLNFTPCVLPLIPIKVMGLQQAAGTRRRSIGLGIVMFLGVVAFWLALGLLIAFVAGFTAANQLFQYPAFTLGVGVLIGVMAVGMMGRFSLTLPQAVYQVNPTQETAAGSFVFGVLIAVLSTPCTAPFMGAAAAWATQQPPAVTLATFLAIGAGMALPYLVLAAAPELVRRLPRTGPASQVVKDVMALLMLAAAAYFIGVGLSGVLVTPPDPPSRLYWWAVAFFVAAAGAWTVYQAVKLGTRRTKVLFGGLGALLVAAALYVAVAFSDQGPIDWTYYTAERFEQALSEEQVVVMEFSAEWCLNCKALEESVLKTPEVLALLDASDVTPIKVDLTGNNPAGNQMLKDVGRVTIPLLVVFAADGTPTFTGDFYTAEQVQAGVEEARRAIAGAPESAG